jgi:hypothetical protein
VTEQMNHVVQDHLDSGFLKKIEYRKVREAGHELDFSIRYFVGATAKDSINRIQGHILNRRKREVAALASVKESNFVKIDELRDVKIEEGVGLPLKAKVAAAGSNFDADAKPDEREDIVLSITTLETHLLPEQKELLTHLTADFMITESKAYELLMKFPAERVGLQVRAFPFRQDEGLEPNNKAGFLIKAIEENYPLPDKFQDRLRAIEREKEQAIQNEKDAIWRQEQDLIIAACDFCNEHELRTITHEEDPHQKVMRICTHDSEIESQFENWKIPKLSDDM